MLRNIFISIFIFTVYTLTSAEPKPKVNKLIPNSGYAGAIVSAIGNNFGNNPQSTYVTVNKKKVKILYIQNDSLTFYIPFSISGKKAKIRVYNETRKSKPVYFEIKKLNVFKIVRFLLGGIAFLLLGIYTLTDGLKKYANKQIRYMVNTATKNRFSAAFTGILFSSASQSSASVSFILMGLVNANLINFTNGLYIIAGANIGATITVLIMQFAIAKYSILLVFAGVILTFYSKARRYQWYLADIILGAGFLFYGIHTLNNAFSPIEGHPAILEFFAKYSSHTFNGNLLYILFGFIAGIMLQSSGAAVAMLIGFAQTTRFLDLNSCITIIIGINISTPFTVLLASKFGDISGKRLALGQFLINGIATLTVVSILPYLANFADYIIPGSPYFFQPNKKIIYPNIASHIAIIFLVVNLLSSVPYLIFHKLFDFIIEKIIPRKTKFKTMDFDFKEKTEIEKLPKILSEMTKSNGKAIEELQNMLFTENRKPLKKIGFLLDKLSDMHNLVVSQSPKLMKKYSDKKHLDLLEQYIYTASEMHKISSLTEHTLELCLKLQEKNISLDENIKQKIKNLGERAIDFINNVSLLILDKDYFEKPEIRYWEIGINRMEEKAKKEIIAKINNGAYSSDAGQVFLQLMSFYEHVGNHLYRVSDFLLTTNE